MNRSALSVGCSWMPFSRNPPDNPTKDPTTRLARCNFLMISITAIRQDPTLTRQPDVDPTSVITFQLLREEETNER